MWSWLKRLFGIIDAPTVSSSVHVQAPTLSVAVDKIIEDEIIEDEIIKNEELGQVEEISGTQTQDKTVDVINKTVFFDVLRVTLFTRGIKTTQVKGIEAILDDMMGQPTSWIAYALATAYHETKKNMKPNTESLNYSVQGLMNTFGRHRISAEDAERLGRKPGEGPLPVARQRAIANIIYGGDWGRRNLGNTKPNDGWKFRGRGMDHCTGRRNYEVTGKDIGVDLLNKPENLLILENAVKALHTGMVTGRYVPGHTFGRYLPSTGNATRHQFRNARRIINGTDKDDLIAGYALDFQDALNKAGYKNLQEKTDD